MNASDNTILENFRQKVFYHGTSWDHAESIAWQVLPKNKRLKQHESINLFRYHYWRAWEKEYKQNAWRHGLRQ